MRIGIDARTILNPEKGDAIGVGHYTFQLIRNLLEIDRENEYVLFFDFRVREKDVKKFTRPNVKIKFYPFSDYKKYLPGAYSEILGTATLQKEKLDVLHSTSPFSRIPLGYKGKTVVTFNDLGAYKIPGCFPAIARSRDKALYRLMESKADRIIAVSESMKKDLQSVFKTKDEKIKIIYSGLDRRFFEIPDINTKKVLDRYGIKKKYILFLGTLEPSKNITRLLQSFAKFKEKCLLKNGQTNGKKFRYQLVLAGKRGWLSKEYLQIAKDLGISRDIAYTGYVIGDELVPLFSGAEFFVMPSLYEGFGMTILEAFATGTPAIVSNVSSIPEIAGDAALMINPLNVNEISEAMWEFSQNDNLREKYKQRGLARAKDFNWEKCARETLEVYKSLI
ncbi:MAG: glycosyltransferase family 4 protein [Candidatus Moranbacteria bacterium]|jgi:glycosyltransferase involved in cell wall biosynthesis|nr:glycosyltransferase family 4 protein [Candidatus Moranbacteria bacterium]